MSVEEQQIIKEQRELTIMEIDAQRVRQSNCSSKDFDQEPDNSILPVPKDLFTDKDYNSGDTKDLQFTLKSAQ